MIQMNLSATRVLILVYFQKRHLKNGRNVCFVSARLIASTSLLSLLPPLVSLFSEQYVIHSVLQVRVMDHVSTTDYSVSDQKHLVFPNKVIYEVLKL
jgi:hypothetical protein